MEMLLGRLQEAGIQVWVEGEKLRYKAPPGALTPELAEAVKRSRDALIAFLASVQERSASVGEIPRVDRQGPLPLHPAQERLWFLDRYEGGRSAAYNIPLALRLEGELDVTALDGALRAVVERHEPLRTTLAMDAGGARQVIHAAEAVFKGLQPQDLSEADLGATLSRRAAELYDLEKSPLFRADLYRLGPTGHVLLLGMHHIISDGWSKSVLMRDLSEAYRAFREGRPPAFPPLPVGYADVAAWMRAQKMDSHVAYWKNRLESLVDLDFPTDRVRPPVKTYVGDRRAFRVRDEVAVGLGRLATDEQASLFMVLSAACSLLLARYSNKEDVVLGAPVAGRDRTEVRDMVGLFVNTLALRADLSGNPTFRTFLRRVRETCLEAYLHQDLPFERVVQALDLQRDPGRTPVFQVLCALQEGSETASLDVPGLRVSEISVDNDTAKFDLAFTFAHEASSLACQVEYNSDLFTPERIMRMQGHLERLLEAASTQPDLPVQEMPMLTAAEHDLIVHEWNRIDPPFVVERTIHEAFEEMAERFPDRIAVTCGNRSLSYRELNERANQVAHTIRDQYQKLHQAPMRPDELIGICVERDIEMVVGLFGILKSGGAYVPLDPRYPEARLRFMATDAQCRMILTQQSCLEQMLFMTEGDFGVISLDGGWDCIARAPRENPQPICGPDHLAYVIYTSGSTGKPKGVLLPHGNVIRLFMATDRHFRFSEHDVWTCFHSYAFDFSVWEIYGALLSGGRLVVVPYYVSRDPEQFVDLVYREGVTVLSQTPSAFYHFAEEVLRSSRVKTPLRYVVYGGEALDIHRLEGWWQRFDPQAPQLVNMYGITETTVHSTFLALSPADLERRHVYSPIGRRLHDLTFYVLDGHRNPVPVAVPGELYLGGRGVARGYFHRPELNRERFIPNRFVDGYVPDEAPPTDAEPPAGPNPRLYKSGDVVRWMADGTLEYVGRNDFQVKIRGFRIELGEIEAVLGRHPAVSECIVLARELGGQQHLVAWYAVRQGVEKPSVQALRAHLGKDLADYMVPSFFVELERLPLTEQGKIDRRALPEPRTEDLVSRSEYVAPSTHNERVLVEIFEDLFKTTGVGAHDNFFALGGNSLTSVQVVYRAREKGVSLNLKDVFTHPTVQDLARCAETGTTVVAEQGAVQGTAPLTPIQAWFFERDVASPSHFNMAALFKCRHPLDETVLGRGLDALVAHHDALRLRFYRGADGHGWEQRFSDAEEAWHVPLDVLALPAGSEAAFIQEQGARIQGTLDIEKGPIVRAALFQGHPDGSQRLMLAVHHLVCDGISWGILLADLETACRQIEAGGTARLPAKTSSFRDWSLALGRYADTRSVRDAWKYWSTAGQGAAPIVTDHSAPDPLVGQTRTMTVSLDAECTRRLVEALSVEDGPNVQDLLLAAALRARLEGSGARELLLSLEHHGRGDCVEGVDVSRTVGCFTSLFPLHLRIPEDVDASDGIALIRTVGEQVRAVPDHGVSYGVLRYMGDDGRRQALRALDGARVGCNYLGQVTPEGDEAWLVEAAEDCGPQEAPDNRASQWLDVACSIAEGRLVCALCYSTLHYEEATMERLGEGLVATLEGLVACCEEARAAGSLPRFARATRVARSAFQPAMSFHEGGSRPPLFFVHPGQGGAEVYLHFSTLLDGEQPFFAVESHNLYSEEPLLAGIEATAKRYIEVVRSVQPQGPYRLGGWCLGGLISYEMALQLRRMGEQVEVIYMIDSFAFGPWERELISTFVDRPMLEEFLQGDPLYHQFPEAYRERLIQASLQEYTDLSVYTHQAYDGDVVLFKALRAMPVPERMDPKVLEVNQELDGAMIPREDNGWKEFLPHLAIVPMDAHHHSIMAGEHIEAVARYIQEDLAKRKRTLVEA